MPTIADFEKFHLTNNWQSKNMNDVADSHHAAENEAKYRGKRHRNKPAPVEKYKISPELMEISKAYGKAAKVSGMLKKGIVYHGGELERLRQALFGIQQQKEMLLNRADPKEPDLDLQPNMELDLQINY